MFLVKSIRTFLLTIALRGSLQSGIALQYFYYFFNSHSLLLHYVHPYMAWLGFFLSFFYYILEVLDPTNYHVWFHLLPTTLDQKGRKFIWLLKLDCADGGNQTRAASTASESAIHYTIASRQLCYIIKNMRVSFAGCFCFSLENFHQKSLLCLQQKSNLSFSFFSPKFFFPT